MDRDNLDSRKLGRILGINVGVIGPMTERRSYDLPSGLSVQVQDAEPVLREWARAVDPEHSCDLIASISAVRHGDPDAFRDELSKFNLDGTVLLRDYQLAFVLRMILSERPRRTRTRRLTASDLAQLCSMVSYLRPTSDSHLDAPGAAGGFFVRMAYQQFWDQEDLAGAWTRGAIVLRRMNELMPERAHYDIDGAFKRLHGIELTAFTFLSFGLYALATQQPGRRFDEANLVGSGDFRVDADEVRAFFALIGMTHRSYQAEAFNPKTYTRDYYSYALNPLIRWPVLIRPGGGYCVPIPRLLLQRATLGVYYDFIPSEERDQFAQFWGSAFEEYAGEVLRRTPGVGTLRRASDVVTRGRVCDWIVDDETSVVVIECKTRGLSAMSKMTGAEEDLRRDIVGSGRGTSLADGVAQLAATAEFLRSAGETRRIVGLLVVLDSFYMGNDRGHMHRLLEEEATTSGANIRACAFQTTDIAGLEYLCRVAIATDRSLGSLILEKVDDAATFKLDMARHSPLKELRVSPHPIFRDVGEPLGQELIDGFVRRSG